MSTSEKTEPLPRARIRIEQLSDLVFGLALSIGSLELLSKTPQSPGELGVSVALFAFSFFIVISTWIGYTRIMTIVSQETGAVVALNLLLLFSVVLEPYLFFIVQASSSVSSDLLLNWASFAYALDVGSMFAILGGLIRVALVMKKPSKEGAELHPLLRQRFQAAMLFYAFIGGVYIASALPSFWVHVAGSYLRFYLWYASFGFIFLGIVNRMRERRLLHSQHK